MDGKLWRKGEFMIASKLISVILLGLLTVGTVNAEAVFDSYLPNRNTPFNHPTTLRIKFRNFPQGMNRVNVLFHPGYASRGCTFIYDSRRADNIVVTRSSDSPSIATLHIPGHFKVTMHDSVRAAKQLQKDGSLPCQIHGFWVTDRSRARTLAYRNMPYVPGESDIIRIGQSLQVYHFKKTFATGHLLYNLKLTEARGGRCQGVVQNPESNPIMVGVFANKNGDYTVRTGAQLNPLGVECIFEMSGHVLPNLHWLIVPAWKMIKRQYQGILIVRVRILNML